MVLTLNKMRQVDFSEYRFRCSSVGTIMVGAVVGLTARQEQELSELRAKMAAGKITDKQLITLGQLVQKANAEPTLSATAKSYLKQLHAREVFGKTKELQGKYLDKGIMAEESAITLYSSVTNTLFIKNKERKSDAYLSGECDNAQGIIRDIKCSWDLDTFPMHQGELDNMLYYWQLQGYMSLWNLEQAELVYCLVDTPDMLIDDEKRRALYRINEMELPAELEAEIEASMRFSDIPEPLRVKVYRVSRDYKAIAALHAQIGIARAYLNQLSTDLADRLISSTNQG
jgi:hypothetical protein